ncbi:hypothetical protein JCM8547_004355 [Rhodosporidiobolus lusitaniae]
MLFKSTFILSLAAAAAAGAAQDASSSRMLKIKRAQDSIIADGAAMAKRAPMEVDSSKLARRSGAHRQDKRHHGDMAKRAAEEKRDVPLFQALLSLLNKTYPGLNTVVLGTEGTLNGAVSGLDDVLKKRSTEFTEVQKRDLSLFQGLLSLLNKTYPGLNTVVLGTEGTLNGAVSGLDDVLKKRDDLPLFQGLFSLLNKVYPGLNTAVLGTEFTLNGAVSGLDDVLKKRSADFSEVEKRDLSLFQGLLSLLNKAYPGLNTVVLGTESTVNGAVSGLDDVLKKRDELPLFQGLLSLLYKTYPGLNTVVLGTEGTLNGVVSGLDDVLKKREATAEPVNEKRDLPLFQGLLSLLNKAYPGLNTVVLGTEGTLNGAVSGLDDVLKKRSEEEKRDLPLFQGLLSLLNKAYPGLNTVVLGTEGTLNGAVSGLDDVLKKRDDIPLLPGLLSLLNKVYPGLNTAVLGTEFTLNGAVSGLDDVLKKRSADIPEHVKRDLTLFNGLLSLLNKTYPGLNTIVLGTQGTLNGVVSGLDDVLKKRDPTITAAAKVDLTNVLNNLLGSGTTSILSSSQLSQVTNLLAPLSSVTQLNSLLGSSFSGSQFTQLNSLLGLTQLNGLLSGLLGGLLGGSSGNLLGGLGGLGLFGRE